MQRFVFPLALVAVSCGGRQAPAPPPSVSNEVTPTAAPTTCADMGPLLRRGLAPDSEGDDPSNLITAFCEKQRWSAEMLACVADANENDAPDCIEHLPADDRTALREKFPPSDEGDSEEAEDSPPESVSCDDVLHVDVATWAPPIANDRPNDLGGKLRLKNLLLQCAGWDEEVVSCLGAAGSTYDQCLASLDHNDRLGVTQAIKSADDLRAKIVKALKTPPAITCAKAASSHYSDAKLKRLRPKDTAAQRKKSMGVARTQFANECTASAWAAEVRACIVVDNGDECFELGGLASTAWRIPLDLDTMPRTGIAECDDYVKAVWTLGACDKVPLDARNSMKENLVSMANALQSLTGEAQEGARQNCKAGADAMRQASVAAGC